MPQTNLVHVHHNKPFTDSLAMAERLAKEENSKPLLKHKQFVFLIRKYEKEFLELGQVAFEKRLSTQGSATEFAELNEDQATFLITLLKNTDIVLRFKLTLVKEFRKAINEISRIQKLLSDPYRKTALIEKRKAGSAMCDSLQFVRELLGKETDAIKYGNEYKFCWRALTGKWDKQDESTLDAYDLRLLEKIRNHNAVLIALHPAQKDRKQMLDGFVAAYRIKFPRLQLVL